MALFLTAAVVWRVANWHIGEKLELARWEEQQKSCPIINDLQKQLADARQAPQAVIDGLKREQEQTKLALAEMDKRVDTVADPQQGDSGCCSEYPDKYTPKTASFQNPQGPKSLTAPSL